MIVRKSLLCLSVCVLSSLYHLSATASQSSANESAATTVTASKAVTSDVDGYIASVYNSIDFGKGDQLAPEVFNKAMRGYLNLKQAGKLQGREILSIVDFTKSSTSNRLWIIDLKQNKVLYNTYVAHGQGSGMEYATAFSNEDNSHQSSLGFYVTGEVYVGQHGNSLRLNGMDNGFNSAALQRGVVVHAADYVSKETISGQGRLGRSWGCPAVNPKLAPAIINTLKNGTCMFLYYPQQQYLKTAYWLNKKVQNVPAGSIEEQLQPTAKAQIAQTIPVVRMDDSANSTTYRIPVSTM